MRFTHPDSIIIAPERQRQEFDLDALQELKNSIEDRGLLHPIVVRQVGEELHLVAGERRLRAIKEIFDFGGNFYCDGTEFSLYVPYVTLGELSTLDAEEAELDENLKRRDLTWQELADAHARLHKLRTAQKAANPTPNLLPIAPQTVADTAKEIHGRSDGAYHDEVRKELIVAKHLANPAVAKAKSLDEAFKILKKQEQAETHRQLAVSVGATFTADSHKLYNSNCLPIMQGLNGVVDVILTDPPYGMGADQFGDAAGKLTGIEHHYDDSVESWRALMTVWCPLTFQIAKPQAHAYVFCDLDRYHELKLFMENAGWKVHRTPFIVHKLDSGRVPWPTTGPRRQWEMVLYAVKGDKPTTHIYSDVIACTADKNMSHGAQKPVTLFQNLLQRSIKPGDTIFDGFVGSGTIFEAAHTYKCNVIGCEMNAEYYGMALKRIEGLRQLEQPGLF